MPPPNTTAATAIVITSLPYSNTQELYEAGVTYDAWYKYLAPEGQNYLSVYGYGTPANYKPRAEVWFGDNPASLEFLNGDFVNQPGIFPITPGITYYLRFEKSGNFNPSPLSMSLIAASTDIAPTGSIIVPDDTDGFGAALISPINGDNYHVYGYLYPFPDGECGDSLIATKRILVEYRSSSNNEEVYLYEKDGTLITTIVVDPFPPFTIMQTIRGHQVLPYWHICWLGTNGEFSRWRTVNNDGTLGPMVTYPFGKGIYDIGANNAGTIVYTQNNYAIINRWDVNTNSFLSDLDLNVTDYAIGGFLVLTDDTLLLFYTQISDPKARMYRKYNLSGGLINTYTFPVAFNNRTFRIARALDDPNSFWIWWTLATNESLFQNIKISDGTVLSEVRSMQYEGGFYDDGETATPVARFGNSYSCPFFITREAIDPLIEPITAAGGIYELVPGKRNDTIFIDPDVGTTENVPIPDPTIKTGLIGS